MQERRKSFVPSKYQGTVADQAHMRTMGRLQESRRNFTFVTMLGFGSTLICTREVVLANIDSVLTNGGTAGLFWYVGTWQCPAVVRMLTSMAGDTCS